MRIAMVTEGTYPHHHGGVSVWCDQLVRGMPEYRFDLHAITGTGRESLAWELPGNATVTPIPLWGGPPGRPPRGRTRRRFEELFREMLDLMLDPWQGSAARFGALLRELLQSGVPLCGETSVRCVLDVWEARRAEFERLGVTPTVRDAVTAVDLIEHSLRPLLRPAPAADVTHVVANGLAVLPAFAAKWTEGTPFVLTEHGVYLRERYLGFRNSPYRWPVKALMLSFLRLLCAAAYLEASLITPGNKFNIRWEVRCGADPARLRTVYNGVDPEQFEPAGSEPEAPTLSWAGRIDPIKDLETLILAFGRVHAKLPEARLRVFGGTPAGREGYLAGCKELAGDLPVAFEGRVDNIRDAYTAGHVVVLSSISEGFPYTLIEAMATGRATVSTDVGGVREAVAGTGLVVPPRDPEAMAEACLTLLNDHELRNRLGAEARERALGLFTVDRAVDSFRTLYPRLVAA
ncbi:GT4 family glycosyltransferase PelF [Acrocarpospora macrocephala]|uniref:Lipopolysaccharide glycosyltransferase, putative n=1 Tax=Acrocarpospora macrocephala TaxID=150177 RepID=A0A5M3WQD2_9ACTN|nr:GT4 family glycosyltransferase PelF [Acrocarpospora macrocephala]GES10686.1 lipopolysaccharide glycosyltransferase, putative [Acrocarpospora macrocephala]